MLPGPHQVEDEDRQPVVPAEGDRREVHDPQVLRDHLHEADLVVTSGVGVDARVGAVDAVDAGVGALQDHLGLDLRGAQAQRACPS